MIDWIFTWMPAIQPIASVLAVSCLWILIYFKSKELKEKTKLYKNTYMAWQEADLEVKRLKERERGSIRK